jgi:hypothetical protein
MSRVFRRPMFRGGSTNMNGIMSGIEDRKNYADGTYSERYKKIFDQYSKPAMDPLSKLLIQGGLRGLSETRGGGTLANMALAFEKPAEQLMSDLQQRKNAERDMALAGLGMDIEDERARAARIQKVKDIQDKQEFDRKQLERKLEGQENIAQLKKNKEIYNSQLYETQVEKMRDSLVGAAGDRIISKYKGSKADDISRKTTDFIMQAPENIKYDLVEIDYIDVGKGKETNFVPDLSNVQQDQIFYDATIGQWKKRISVGNGKLDFITLDPYNNYQPIDIDQD